MRNHPDVRFDVVIVHIDCGQDRVAAGWDFALQFDRKDAVPCLRRGAGVQHFTLR
jgi:hypothetical protein